jgi:hypothetical protein
MNKFVEYLISLGYVGSGCTSLNFSSMRENGCWLVLKKDNSRFTLGLEEHGIPPTLIFPKKIYTERNGNTITTRLFSSAEMLDYLIKNEPEFIYNDLYKDSLR